MIESRVAARHCDCFTLIEILVVVAIISILASIALYNFMEAQTRAKVTRVQSDMRTMSVAIETYRLDNGEYPRVNPNVYQNPGDPGSFLLISPHDNFMYYEGGFEAVMGPGGGCPTCFTTPIAYLSSHPPLDPFIGKMELSDLGPERMAVGRRNCSFFFYDFYAAARQRLQGWNDRELAPVVYPCDTRFNEGRLLIHPEWAIMSPGPDKTFAVENPDDVNDPFMSCDFFPSKTSWRGMVEARFSLYDPTNGTDSAGDIWRTNAGAL